MGKKAENKSKLRQVASVMILETNLSYQQRCANVWQYYWIWIEAQVPKTVLTLMAQLCIKKPSKLNKKRENRQFKKDSRLFNLVLKKI